MLYRLCLALTPGPSTDRYSFYALLNPPGVFQAVSLSSRGRARAVNIVGTAASSHELFLLSYCYLDLPLWGRWMCLS